MCKKGSCGSDSCKCQESKDQNYPQNDTQKEVEPTPHVCACGGSCGKSKK